MRSYSLISLAIFVSAAYCADFTTYIGDQDQYQVTGIAADSAGDTWVTGSRIQSTNGDATYTVFITKLDSSGNLLFTKTFPGYGGAITVDSSGNIWVGGAAGPNFPLLSPLPGTTYLLDGGFLMKLAPDGTTLYASYFYGGLSGIETDSSGNVYVIGSTISSAFPTTPGLPNDSAELGTFGASQVSGTFFAKVDPTGSKLLYSSVIAGTHVDCSGGSTCFLSNASTTGVGIAVDAAGEAIIAGSTNVLDLPITPGAVAGYGAFAAKVNAAGTQLVYLTYIGPANGDIDVLGPAQGIGASAIVCDAAGDAYVTGSTNDTKFPATAGAFQTTLSGDLTLDFPTYDAYAVKLNPSGDVVWGTYLGGPANDAANAIALDADGDVWLVGNNGAGFSGGRLGSVATAGDFLAELSPDGSMLLNEQEFTSGTEGQALTIDSAGVLHVSGVNGLVWTITPGVPYAARIFGIMNAVGSQLSGRIAPGEIVSIFGAGMGPALGTSAKLVDGHFPTSVDGVQVLLNGSPIPLIWVSASQINAEIPAPVTVDASDAATIQVINGSTPQSSTLPDFRVALDSTIFAIFQNPDGSVAAINQDDTVNSQANPAKAGTIVAMWATGMIAPGAIVDGAITMGADNWCSSCQFSVGTTTETAAYAGTAPGLIDGAMQINLSVPHQPGNTKLQVFYKGQVYGFIYVSE
jgi:uncharacterized protein (TIGR03437 family)